MTRTNQRKLFNNYVYIVVLIYLIFTVISGPLRFYTYQLGISYIVYLPQVLMAITLMLYPIIRRNIYTIELLVFLIILIFAIIGFLYIQNLKQVLFGLYTFIPCLFGGLAVNTLRNNFEKKSSPFLLLFFIACVGVIINMNFIFPWEGFEYSVLSTNISANKLWTYFSLKRLAGFSRASYSAASQILILSFWLLFQKRKLIIKSIILALAGVAIILTTSKGIILTYIISIIFLLFCKLIHKKIWVLASWVISFLVIVIPLVSLIMGIFPKKFNPTAEPLLFSLYDRTINYWPDFFSFIQSNGNVILGRGIGGIGASQMYFEKINYYPGDNLFVYLYAIFGIISIPIILSYPWFSLRLNIKNNNFDGFIFMIILSLLSYGMVANIVEEPFFLFFSGVAMSRILTKSHQKLEFNIIQSSQFIRYTRFN